MSWFIATAILLVAAYVIWRFLVPPFRKREETHQAIKDQGIGNADPSWWRMWRMIAQGAAVGCVAGWLILTGLSVVWLIPAGHVGVVYRFGDIVGQRDSGMQLVAPWEDVKVASTRTQREQFVRLAAFSKETQDVFVDATLNYNVSPTAIQDLYRTVGPDWFEKLVPPRVRQTLKDESVKYLTVDVAPNREKIRRNVRDRLREQLEPYSVEVEDFLLDNIDFRPEFKNAIEEKQIATQEALAEQNRVQAAKFKKQQAIQTAQGEAQSVLIKKRAEAQGNRLLRRSLTEEVIAFEAIQKLNPNVNTILVPAGSNLILPQSLLQPKTADSTP